MQFEKGMCNNRNEYMMRDQRYTVKKLRKMVQLLSKYSQQHVTRNYSYKINWNLL